MAGNYINHIIVLGQSLSTGYKTSLVLPTAQESKKALMFKHARTLDFGYIYGISEAEYLAGSDTYDNDFYSAFNTLVEEGDYGNIGTEWRNSHYEYESPSSGIAEGLYNSYVEDGKSDMPFYTLFTAAGAGGEMIASFEKGTEIYNKVIKDVEKAKALADSLNMYYNVSFVAWIQGEGDRGETVDSYKTALAQIILDLNADIKSISEQHNDIELMSYQTNVSNNTGSLGMKSTLAQMELSTENSRYNIAAPIYNLETNNVIYDHLHLTALSSRLMGNSIGRAIYQKLYGNYSTFKPTYSIVGSTITLVFDRDIEFDSASLADSEVSLADVTTNKGFFALNGSGVEVSTSVTLTDSMTITIICSVAPDTLQYGYLDEDVNVLGGLVREVETFDSYLTNKLLLYMPIQKIN